ncbi:beta-glucuronidase [Butyrivibrio sp. WCD3002]|uniref:beta-glucuronidase n=1 Tax=Butyrivibrio sp. WCD3002 TaxID=1280676 RepID=UPI00047D2185|nr:beta-glucuronidase [Butyrivibrio sp. WCD3002]
MESLLYPIRNRFRDEMKLDGLWRFSFDREEKGEGDGWTKGLPKSAINMPVPASFNDFFTDKESRDYCGPFWYECDFYAPEKQEGKKTYIRFGSVTHRATVYVNGVEVGSHEGGFLPFVLDVSEAVNYGENNKLVVKANNELDETTLPCGNVSTLKNGKKLVKPYFDFFNYAGIHRSVWVMSLKNEHITDYDVVTDINGDTAVVKVKLVAASASFKLKGKVVLKDRDGKVVADSTFDMSDSNNTDNTVSGKCELTVKEPVLWDVKKPYLYDIELSVIDGEVIDSYEDKIGIRSIEIKGTDILLNGKPVYLKGFGKHEDFDIIGRGFNYGVAKRDFECMKWIGANCFRTSHYPYAEEWYRFADEEGFLIIDEVPAVGMMRSFFNFMDAGRGAKYTYFFETDTVPKLKENHLNAVREMIVRDKNHPSVISFSLFNEPETISTFAHDYFKDIFEYARELDPQKRPLTGALEKTSAPDKCQCYQFCDFISLNRYYGWYISGGSELSDARELFIEEMDQWKALNLNKPFVFTEFGADTLATEHKLPSVMWTQEYQNEYYDMNFEIFDKYDFVKGELTWNFADFQTSEGTFRVAGNKKGVFSRNRQPKDIAFKLKERWEK